jgi:hypothetical protein
MKSFYLQHKQKDFFISFLQISLIKLFQIRELKVIQPSVKHLGGDVTIWDCFVGGTVNNFIKKMDHDSPEVCICKLQMIWTFKFQMALP